MLTALIKKEVTHQLRSSRFATITLIMLVLSLLAALAGTEDYRRRSRDHQSHVEQSEASLGRLYVYSEMRQVLVREPEPLSVLDRGFEDRMGEEIVVEMKSVPSAVDGGRPRRDFMAGSPGVDLTTIVQLVLGLAALVLTFDAFVGERRDGTLKITLANDVAPATVAIGKVAGAWLALLLPMLAGTGLSLMVLVFRGGVSLGADHWQRIAGLLVIYLSYLFLMTLVGLLISMSSPTPSASLVTSLLIWLVVVFLMPQTEGVLAGGIGKGASEQKAMRDAVFEAEGDRDRRLRELEEWDPRLVRDFGHYAPVAMADRRRFGTAKFYDRLAGYYSRSLPVFLEAADDVFGVRYQYVQQWHEASRDAQRPLWLSPAFLMARAAESMAGTSSADYDQHLDETRRYRLEVIDYLEREKAFSAWRWFTDDPPEALTPWTSLLPEPVDPDDVDASNFQELVKQFSSPEVQTKVADQIRDYERDSSRLLDLTGMPRFESRKLEPRRAVLRIGHELGLLALMNVLLASILFVGIRRYSPSQSVGGAYGRQPLKSRWMFGARRRDKAVVRGTAGQ